ncbi:MAG: DciA family protein [Chromatiales bacterium]|jgi:hypothetical protein
MQKLTNLLFSKRRLNYLQNQLTLQEKLLQQVHACLPSPLDQHCLGAIPHGKTLILLAESSAWASRLRYLAGEILKQLKHREIRFERIQVRVSIERRLVQPKRPSRRALPLSRENAQLLRCLAESLDDAQLSSALQRLSRHTTG